MFDRRRLLVAFTLVGAASMLAAGCAGQREPRNFVQADVVAKDDLVGKDGKAIWYFRQTVLDAPYTNGFTFIGEQSETEKIRWDIQQDVLYARRTYEFVRNTEQNLAAAEEANNPDNYQGAPVAAFRIRSHFDIIRDYNPATGEEVNRIIESQERKWYERRFIRVDWSQNLISNFTFLIDFASDGVKPIKTEPVPYFVSDPNHPDAMRFVRPAPTAEDPNPTATYFDVVNKLIASPEQITFSFSDGAFSLPACFLTDYLGAGANPDCGAAELKVRHSFMRADKRDYEPRVYRDTEMDRFGYFSTERRGYNRQYGVTESYRYRLINRYNLWQQSMTDTACQIVIDPNQNITPDIQGLVDQGYDQDTAERLARENVRNSAQYAANAQCEAAHGVGSECNNVLNRCTIPVYARTPKPIIYYLNAGWPESMRQAALDNIAEWDDVFCQTVIRALHPEDDQKDTALYQQRKAELRAVLQPPADHPALGCGMVQMRDNDCSIGNVQAFVQANSQYAEVVQAATGRDVASLDNTVLVQACAALENHTANVPEGPKFTWQRNGDLRYNLLYWVDQPHRSSPLGYGPSAHDPETGETIQGNAYIYGAGLDTYAQFGVDIVRLLNGEHSYGAFLDGVDVRHYVDATRDGVSTRRLSLDQVKQMARAMKFDWAKNLLPNYPLDRRSTRALMKSLRERHALLGGEGPLGDRGFKSHTRLEALRGTPIEAAIREHLARNPNALAPDGTGTPDGVDVLKQYLPAFTFKREKALDRMRARGADFADFADDSVIGLAREYAERGYNADQIRDELRVRIFRGLTGHELGHTFGLRHNFQGSYDSLNYISGKLNAAGEPRLDIFGNQLPGYWELRTAGRGGDRPLGPRYIDPETDAEKQGQIRLRMYSTTMDYGSRFSSDILGLGRYDYASIMYGYANLVEVFRNVPQDQRERLGSFQIQVAFGLPQPLYCGSDVDQSRHPIGCSSIHYTEIPRMTGGDPEDREIIPANLVAPVAPGSDAALAPLDGVLTEKANPTDLAGSPSGRIVVPYRFCSDEFAGASQICNRFDEGADIYELTADNIDRYNNYYIFNNFARDRVGFGYLGSYLDRIQYRFFDRLRSNMQFYTLLRSDFEQYNVAPDDPFWTLPDAMGAWTVSVDMTFNHFLNVLAQPEPGPYLAGRAPDGSQAWVKVPDYYAPTAPLNLSVPDGKYYATVWDYDTGYFWYDKVRYVGAFYDKFLALINLTDPETHFLGRDTASDLREYAINYFRIYPDRVQDVFGALQADQWSKFASLVSNGDTRLIKRNFTDGSLGGPNGALPVEPQTGFSVQLFAGVLGTALIPGVWDRSFAEYSRVWVDGDQTGGSGSTTQPLVTWTQPPELGGKTYYAPSFVVNGEEMGLGARMLNRAIQLQNSGDFTALARYNQNIDLMRSLTYYFAYTSF